MQISNNKLLFIKGKMKLWDETSLHISWGMVLHNVLMASIGPCFRLILHLLASVQEFRALLAVWIKMACHVLWQWYRCISLRYFSGSPCRNTYISHRYPQCTYSNIVILMQFAESKDYNVCNLFGYRQEENKSRKQPYRIRPLVHIDQFFGLKQGTERWTLL